MSLPGKKTRDLSQLPTLSYEVKLNLPTNVDSNPQEISFLDLVANDNKFKNDKDSLELVLSSYVKACGKQSVKEILAERDNIMEDNASLSDIIRALMDYNDQQNANLGVGYNDPDDDDSFIDDSTAAQDIIPKNMTNERDGFYVNEKHQPIQAKYLSESSGSEMDDEEDESDESEDDEDESSASEKEDNQNKNELNEKIAKKSKIDEDLSVKVLNTKRKRSISEVSTPSLSANLDEKNKLVKSTDESVKKVKKLSETTTTSEISSQNSISYILPPEMDADIRSCVEKLVKLISLDQTITHVPKKIERLYEKNLCHELLDLVKKLHRHTNAHRQLVFDLLGSRTGISPPILITRARLLLLNDYESTAASMSMKDLKEKLKTEINRSLDFHIQAHNQAIKEWQQKLSENPSKDKNRGPRKNFRLHKTINELIIRCVDRQLETMGILDLDSLESFLHDHIVPLWDKPGWMTAKKIITEVIRIEYRPLKDPNLPVTTQIIQSSRVTPIIDRTKKDAPIIVPASATKILNPTSTITNNVPKTPQTQSLKTNETKSSSNSQPKLIETATRVSAVNPVKQPTIRPEPIATNLIPEQLYSKPSKTEVIRPIAKPAVISPSSQPESAPKRHSTPNVSTSAIDLSADLYSQYKKHLTESSKPITNSSSNKDLSSSSSSQRSTTTTAASVQNPKQSQSQQQQQFATKLPSEKHPTGSFLKEALGGSSSPKISSSSASPKISASPLTVDSMISKSLQSPKPTSNSTPMKTPTNIQSPTSHNQRPSSSQKVVTSTMATSSTSRSSNEPSHHRTDQQQKTSSSSNRPSSSSNSSSSSRRSTPGFSSTHDQQSSRSHSSQVPIPPSLSQALQWDSTTLQLAAAALANPQLLNSSVFDPTLFNSLFASAANMVPPTQSPTSSRQQHSQNINNNRRT